MSPTAEQEILRNLDRITTILLGAEGQEDTGFINRTQAALKEHDKRINSVEKWMWRCAGGAALLVVGIEAARLLMR